MKYKNYLRNIKSYTSSTTRLYVKYAKELKEYNFDYKKMMKKYENLSNNTKRLVLSAIKKYYKWINDSRWSEIELPKRNFKFLDYVSFKEYETYLKKINSNTKMGFQKRVIIRIFFETGIRSSELLLISKKDINGRKILIKGKGNKERVVNLSNCLKRELDKYVETIDKNFLFDFGYKNLHKKISLVDKDKNVSPHMFRRGYAKYCHDMGVSLYDISISMGHSSVETTSKYIKRGSEDIQIYKIFNMTI